MKKLLALILILVFLPVVSFADDPDPIVGAWYIMLDYNEIPVSAETAGKEFMFYIVFFDESGTISAVSGESLTSTGLYASGSAIGTWSKSGEKYTANMIGIGSNSAEISGDRLYLQMMPNVWYSMQRFHMGSWYSDIVVIPPTT